MHTHTNRTLTLFFKEHLGHAVSYIYSFVLTALLLTFKSNNFFRVRKTSDISKMERESDKACRL